MDDKTKLLQWFSEQQAKGSYFSRRELAKLTVGQKTAMGCPALSRAGIVRFTTQLHREGCLRVVDPVYCKYVVVGQEVHLTDRGFGSEPPAREESPDGPET